MGSLVRRILGESQIGFGVNILEVQPPGNISGVKSNVVGIVGDFPWGPINSIQRITTAAELFATFCPAPFNAADTYAALKAFLSKTFPGGMRVVRIAATDQAAASSGAITAGSGTLTITANYKGALGNSISYQFTAATNENAAQRDLVITIGTTYSVRYKNLTTTTVLLVDDPYVTVTGSSPSAMPTAGSATALTSGADGTAAASDYVGSSSSAVGIRLFYAETDDADVDVLFVAECPSSLCATVNSGLESYASDNDRGLVVLSTPNNQTSAAAITYVADYRDDRIVYAWPRVLVTDFYASDLAETEVDGNSFVAAAILNLDPEISPGGASGAPFLKGITGLEVETTSRTTYDDLRDAGVASLFLSKTLGPCLYGGITTSITSGLTQIFRRRMTDYLTESIAAYAENYVSKPLDLTLASQTLGDNTGGLYNAIVGFLAGLKTKGRIHSYSVDAFGGNTQDDLDNGRWTILMSVKLFAAMDEIVLKANVGETVQIEE